MVKKINMLQTRASFSAVALHNFSFLFILFISPYFCFFFVKFCSNCLKIFLINQLTAYFSRNYEVSSTLIFK